jgi:ABC-type polysaccharide/polyol phosphate export permease
MLARLMDFGIAYLILLVLMFIYRIPVNFSALMFLPLVLAIQIILITGLGLALSAANVFFRDVGSVLGLVMSLWFYASPIIYPITTIPEQYRSLYFLNPMAGILEAYRDILINGQIPGAYMIPAIVISLVLLAFGYWFFKRVEFLFADIV